MIKMKILVACEESQSVTKELRNLSHEAYSCDIVPQSGGHDEWHIQSDVIALLDGNCQFKTVDGVKHMIDGKWDMIIAFPPCTHLAVSGARHFTQKREDGRQKDGIEFFMKFLNADCDKIVVENPIGIISGEYIPKHFPNIAKKYGLPIKPNQITHPWMFGDNFSKSTCLWIKGLPNLIPTIVEQPELEYFEWTDKKTGKKKKTAKVVCRCLEIASKRKG
jgi:site-specific DNA-cytosine methylase